MTNRYDQVPYESKPFPDSHPDRLCTLGRLFGLSPSPVESCRVLEIGCAAGGNLLGMAEQLPDSQFLGIDYSTVEIDEGRQAVAAIGLDNVRLERVDIADADPGSLGRFDYVVAHGVYSWVPPPIQEAMLSMVRQVLAPHGIAYISYNTLPGWHMRGMIRDMMLYHTRDFADPETQIRQARALLSFLAESMSADGSPFGMLVHRELETLSKLSDSYLFHDLLEPDNHAVYFHTFRDRIAAHGLKYLGDADISTMLSTRFPMQTQEVLARVAGDVVRSEQYMDFLSNRTFRRTLLCHEAVEIDRHVGWEHIRHMYISSTVTPKEEVQLDSGRPELFTTRTGRRLSTQLPILKAALLILSEQRPRAIGFEELVQASIARLGDGEPDDVRQLLGRNLLTCFTQKVVRLYPRELPISIAVGDRPRVSRVARHQASQGGGLTNQRHEWFVLQEFDRRIVMLLDGTRTVPEVVQAMVELALSGDIKVSKDERPITDRDEMEALFVETVAERLGRLGHAGLFES